ncbi:MAG: hypothetical protein IT307_16660 [Chloroflexi bacterium]|nr:hypothetical protein [Chloroflexota bacterium]
MNVPLLIPGSRRSRGLFSSLLGLLLVFTTACGSGNSGFPRDKGDYSIQPNSLTYDGESYAFFWVDASGGLHQAKGKDVRLVQNDARTYLTVGDGSPIVHLKADEGIIVRGRDRGGEYSTSWFPFFAGYALGGMGNWGGYRPPPDTLSGDRTPSYRYPPTDSFGRDEQLNGSISQPKAQTPDYSKVAPAPYSVSGQSGGTGGGNAATNKSTGPLSGQAGGTGAGSAASNKGTFSAKPSTGSGGTGVGGGSGLSGSSGRGSSVSPPSSGSRSAPSRPSFGGGGRRR